MDFEQRLQRAIERGTQVRAAADRQDAERQLTGEELKNLYSLARLELSEHIENCLRKLADYFPGFDYSSIVGDAGWGARIVRDDFVSGPGRVHESQYSRVEMTVSPRGSVDIAEVVAKATIRNREVFHRRHFQRLIELDLPSFKAQIDAWVLDYAETFAAHSS
jgi:hypothetical protein